MGRCYLSDCAVALLPPDLLCPPSRVAPSEPTAALFRALGGAVHGTCHPLPDGALAPWATLFFVQAAQTSQLDLLHARMGAEPTLPAPVAACALSGRAFHGLRGRSWRALPGNVHLVASFRCAVPVGPIAAALTMLPAVAAAEAVREVTGGRVAPGIKWVNDLWVDGRKLAGVLTRTTICGTRLSLVTYGIGLNRVDAPPLPESPSTPRATSLRDLLGDAPSHGAVVAALLGALARHQATLLADGPEDLVARYQRLSLIVGRRVRVFDENETFEGPVAPTPIAEGVVERIGPDLALHLTGHPAPVTRGRVVIQGGRKVRPA